nr:MAG TPA: tail-collar fiber protein [Caudoviricetes sp.]
MAQNVIITKKARKKLLQARAGDITLPKIIGMAFGSGGVDTSGNVIAPLENQETLKAELLRKPVRGHSFIGETTCRYECTLSESELAGQYISEIGLYDAEGDIVCIKTFTKKGKDSDIEMTYTLDDVF